MSRRVSVQYRRAIRICAVQPSNGSSSLFFSTWSRRTFSVSQSQVSRNWLLGTYYLLMTDQFTNYPQDPAKSLWKPGGPLCRDAISYFGFWGYSKSIQWNNAALFLLSSNQVPIVLFFLTFYDFSQSSVWKSTEQHLRPSARYRWCSEHVPAVLISHSSYLKWLHWVWPTIGDTGSAASSHWEWKGSGVWKMRTQKVS